jgi:glutamyl-tRNA synthetase
MSVRVRFAPSPSGSLHVGGARTALYNWLFARKNDGTFVLRIEDTDVETASDESVNSIVNELRWLGLDWDEGIEVGGPHAPYRQSERLDFYSDASTRLSKDGHAYRCYCTPEELAERREHALQHGRKPGYDGRCYRLSDKERTDFEAEGRRWVQRFHVPEGETTFLDLITGPVTIKHQEIDDFAIFRQNGRPLYQLGAALDDALMEISHVIRGMDTQSSTPRQILLLQALGHRVPHYAHIPLVVGPGGQKLSKRKDDTNIEWYQDHGFLPEAMVNFLVLLGMGYGDETIVSIEDMIKDFDLSKVNSSPAKFDIDKLTWMNGEYIRALDEEQLAGRLEVFFIREGFITSKPSQAEHELTKRITRLVQTRIARLDEAAKYVRALFLDVDMDPTAVQKVMLADYVHELLQRSIVALGKLGTWNAGVIEEALRAIVDDMKLKPRRAYVPLYVAISGSTVSAPLFDSMEILGKETSLERLERAQSEVSSQNGHDPE